MLGKRCLHLGQPIVPDKDRLVSWKSNACQRRNWCLRETVAQLILYHGRPPIRRCILVPPTGTDTPSLDPVFVLEAVPARERNLQTLRDHRSEERRVGKECRSRWSP